MGDRARERRCHEHPHVGGAAYVYNVIDVRQSYLQKLLKQALIAVGHPEGAQRSHHFSYEMVALSHATARELGFAPAPDSEEAKRPFVEVSGRKGLGVKADDLLDIVIKKAGEEVAKRNPELAEEEAQQIAGLIGVAAVRYFLVKFSRGKVIAFDLEEALSFRARAGRTFNTQSSGSTTSSASCRSGMVSTTRRWSARWRRLPAGELTGDNGDTSCGRWCSRPRAWTKSSSR